MPTDKKRVNLTIPEDVYARLQAYRTKYAIATDAGACLQLIIRQLDSIANGEQMMQMMSRFNMDELKELSDIGLASLKLAIDSKKENSDL